MLIIINLQFPQFSGYILEFNSNIIVPTLTWLQMNSPIAILIPTNFTFNNTYS